MKYELKFDDVEDKDVYRAQMHIIESMKTEYSSTGMYGDFGRYTFQSLLDNWDESIEEVSNYTIKMIFEEIGYDPMSFKDFDNQHSSRQRPDGRKERPRTVGVGSGILCRKEG